ncbi:uncharacterized protein ASCRUDRAFT_69759 [Ascoidea rubescens DSM 1968]|uniref:C3H1-type domain-containing protein n=1 Tax=Ascoidea rubescens DSM 1968 TaxID=1344418 RepID=A0A1D2VKD3_9ASCO|nr:hypothetical protein ASCRUDRAFT_69759 [Ascoidea rubescens DSM 1968]ODV62071.1 hypothetical protein ASCRUDRAFT_69759 [Ascoidea rubescens DSM 1968]
MTIYYNFDFSQSETTNSDKKSIYRFENEPLKQLNKIECIDHTNEEIKRTNKTINGINERIIKSVWKSAKICYYNNCNGCNLICAQKHYSILHNKLLSCPMNERVIKNYQKLLRLICDLSIRENNKRDKQNNQDNQDRKDEQDEKDRRDGKDRKDGKDGKDEKDKNDENERRYGRDKENWNDYYSKAKKRNYLYRTQLCRSVIENSKCKYGVNCNYAHSEKELCPKKIFPSRYLTKSCIYRERKKCPYSHIIDNMNDISRKNEQKHDCIRLALAFHQEGNTQTNKTAKKEHAMLLLPELILIWVLRIDQNRRRKDS